MMPTKKTAEQIASVGMTSTRVEHASATTPAVGGGLANLSGARALLLRTLVSGNTVTGANGGGVDNAGTLTLRESVLQLNNTTGAGGGGGLATETGGVSRIVRSAIRRNTTAGSGGGILNAGTTSLFRTLVERNTATVAGGGISNVAPGTVTLRISAVRANTPGNCSPVNTIPGCVG